MPALPKSNLLFLTHMKTIGNIIWFLLGGWIGGTLWFLLGLVCFCTIILIPFGYACWRIASFALAPFGKDLVDARDLGEERVSMTGLGNFLWCILFGLWVSIGCVLAGISAFLTIVLIPFGIAYFKIAAAAFSPLGKRVVSTEIAQEIRRRKASAEIDRRLGKTTSVEPSA